jgi:hypothetical protein
MGQSFDSILCADVRIEPDISYILIFKGWSVAFGIIGCLPLLAFVMQALYNKRKRAVPDNWVQMQDTHEHLRQAATIP